MADRYKSLREMNDEDALERAMTDAKTFTSAKQKALQRGKRYKAMYKAKDNPELRVNPGTGKIQDDPKLRSNNYLPLGASVVDANVSQLYNAFFASDNYFRIGADNWDDEIYTYKITAHLMKRHREMQFRHTAFQTLLEANIYDYAVTGTRWLLESGYVAKRRKEITHKQLGRLRLPYQSVKIEQQWVPDAVDRSDVFRIGYFNCAHDPGHVENGFKDSRGFVDWRWVMIEELKSGAKTEDQPWGKYKNIDKVVQSAMKRINKTHATGGADLSGLDDITRQSVENGLRVKVFRYWTSDHIVEYAEDEVISRLNISGWPLQLWKIFDLPGEFRGMGILERMERNQYDINAQMNNSRDHQNLIVDPIAVLSKDILGADGSKTVHHGRIFVSSGSKASDGIYVYNPGPQPHNATEDIITQMKVIEKVTISETAMGAGSTTRRTAFEVNKIDQGSDSKTLQRAHILELTCLEPIYMNQFKLEQEFLTKWERFKHYGRESEHMMLIGPEDYAFETQPSFEALGTSDLINEPLMINNLMKAMEIGMTNPEIYKRIKWGPAASELFRLLIPKHYRQIIKDEREPQYSVPPEDENKLIAMGHTVLVNERDDNEDHLRKHNAVKQSPDYSTWNQKNKDILDQHMAAHEQAGAGAANLFPGGQPLIGQGQDQSDPLRGIRPTQELGGATQ